MTDLFTKLGPWALGLIFQAGILYAVIRAMGRDLNGVGRKVRGIQEANEQRYITIVVVSLMSEVPEANRAAYIAKARMFLDAAKGRNL